jgi:glycosyltransferase involved in cell wall biosynthesis
MPDTEVATFLMNEGTLADKLRSAGIPVYMANEQNAGSLWIFARLRRALRSWRPDVIHTHREKENVLGSLANRSFRNVPSVRTIHGAKEFSRVTGWSGIRRGGINALDGWCGRSLQQRVIAVTRELGAKVAAELPMDKVVVIENGVDTAAVRAEKGTAEFRTAEPDATHIGIVGRLVEVKRVDLFLETGSLLLQSFPQRRWRFHVFGEGSARARLEKLSDLLQISKRVTFHGHRQDIATCMAGLDALVICSDHEGMPMGALEAAALGVPTVAHAVGGLLELVPQEFLVVRHDAHGYRDAILRSLHGDGRTIAERQAVVTLEQFSAQRNAERIRVVYEQVIAERTKR